MKNLIFCVLLFVITPLQKDLFEVKEHDPDDFQCYLLTHSVW